MASPKSEIKCKVCQLSHSSDEVVEFRLSIICVVCRSEILIDELIAKDEETKLFEINKMATYVKVHIDNIDGSNATRIFHIFMTMTDILSDKKLMNLEAINAINDLMTKTIEQKEDELKLDIQQFIFVGKSGVGKSSLLNLLLNEDPTNVMKPSLVNSIASGVTDQISYYYKSMSKTLFIDTIGFGDPKFRLYAHSLLLRFIKILRYKGSKLILIIEHNRLSKDEMEMIVLLNDLIINFNKSAMIIFTKSQYNFLFSDWLNNKNSNLLTDDDMKLYDKVISILCTFDKDNILNIDNSPNPDYYSVVREKRIQLITNFNVKIKKIEEIKHKVTRGGLCLRYFHLPTHDISDDDFSKLRMVTHILKINGHFGICPICLEDIIGIDNVIFTECSHGFHKICLGSWIKLNQICPLCKTDQSWEILHCLD